MHLVSNADQRFTVAGRRFGMRAGETIHTENSYKYSLDQARLLAAVGGWDPLGCWTDSAGLFSVHLWQASPALAHP